MTIPESITRLCCSRGKSNALVILAHCKEIYGPYTKSLSLGLLCDRTGISVSTVRRCLNWLLKRNWIGRDQKTGVWYMRGWNDIRRIEGMSIRHRWEIKAGKASEMIKAFHGSIISGVLRTQKHWQKVRDRANGNAAIKRKQAGFKCSVRFAAKVTGTSVSKMHRIKQSAKSGGHIAVRRSRLTKDQKNVLRGLISIERKQIDYDQGQIEAFRNPVHIIETCMVSGKTGCKLKRSKSKQK